MGSFRLKVDSPGLVIVDSTDDKQHSTTLLLKNAFCLDFFCSHYLGQVFCTILESPTIAMSILNIFCIKLSLQNVVDHYTLSVSLWRLFLDKSTSGKSTSNMPRVFSAHESQEQHYTQVLNAHQINPNNNTTHVIYYVFIHQPQLSQLLRINHSCFTVFGDFGTASEG